MTEEKSIISLSKDKVSSDEVSSDEDSAQDALFNDMSIACEKGDIDTVKKLITEDNVNWLTVGGESFLGSALLCGNTEVAEYLISIGGLVYKTSDVYGMLKTIEKLQMNNGSFDLINIIDKNEEELKEQIRELEQKKQEIQQKHKEQDEIIKELQERKKFLKQQLSQIHKIAKTAAVKENIEVEQLTS